MRILNLEDDVFKHRDICKALEGEVSNLSIAHVDNLEDGVNMIKANVENNTPFDLIITDMWYPRVAHGQETKSGEELIELAAANGWKTPIIVCSSVRYNIPEILGAVHYRPNGDWDEELVKLVRWIE